MTTPVKVGTPVQDHPGAVARPTVTFIGNATTLISTGDLTLLTDPNFLQRGQYAHLGYGLMSRRLHGPALTIDQLPHLDAIVLSHLHGDHWDRVSQRHLDHRLPVLTTLHAANVLRRRGFPGAVGMTPWQSHTMTGRRSRITVTSLPGRHARLLAQPLMPPVMGTMLEIGPLVGPVSSRIYVSGDSLLIDELSDIPKRFGPITAGVLHLGGTRLPAGDHLPFGLTVTMDGRQGADAVELLGLPTVIPVHYDDYGVFASPLSEFEDEMARRGLVERIVELTRGGSVKL